MKNLRGTNILKRIFLICLLCLISITCYAVTPEEIIGMGYERVAQNSKLSLFANVDSGGVALLNHGSGKVWYSNPPNVSGDGVANDLAKRSLASQVSIVYRSNNKIGENYQEYRTDNYTSSIMKKTFNFENVQNGIKFVFNFDDEKFVIPIQYTLGEDYMSAEIVWDEIVADVDREVEMTNSFTKEKQFYKYRSTIIDLTLLPYICSGEKSENGYMLVPDGPGGLINFNNGKQDAENYRQSVYGVDRTTPSGESVDATTAVKLPVFGVSSGNDVLMGIITQSDGAAYIEAAVSGKLNDYNNVCGGISLHYFDGVNISRPVYGKVPTYEIRYYPLFGEDANYSGMARRYRNYLIDEKGLQEPENVEDAVVYVDLYGGIKKQKFIFGFPITSIEPLTTYEDCITVLEELKSVGIEDTNLIYNAWMSGGYKAKYSKEIKYEGKLGGRGGFRKLQQYAEDNSVNIFPAVDFVNIFKSGSGISQVFDCAQKINTAPGYQFLKARNSLDRDQLGKWSILKLENIMKVTEKFFNEKQDISEFYVSGMADTITSDFASDGQTKGDAVQYWETILKDATDRPEHSFLTGWANSYAIPYSDYMTDVSAEGNGYDIIDEYVPFYQMVIHGYVPYSSTPINLSSDPGYLFLKSVETGAALKYSWIGQDVSRLQKTELNRLFSADYKFWLGSAAENYQRYSDLYDRVGGQEMVSHKRLAEGVYEVSYEDVRVIINYNNEDYAGSSYTVKASDFIVMEGNE